MRYDDYILKPEIVRLPYEKSEIIKKMIKIKPRPALEALLVTTNVKPGDAIPTDENYQELLQLIGQLPNIKFIKQEKLTFFYNPSLVEKEVIDYLTNYTEKEFMNEVVASAKGEKRDKPIEFFMAKIYGIPECCFKMYMETKDEGRTTTPGTEHVWCTPDCKVSLAIKEAYEQAIIINLPEEIGLLDCFT